MQISYSVIIVCMCFVVQGDSVVDDASSITEIGAVEDVVDDLDTLDNVRSDSVDPEQPHPTVTTDKPKPINTSQPDNITNESAPANESFSESSPISTSTSPETSTSASTISSPTSTTTWPTSSDWYDEMEEMEDESCYTNPMLTTFCVLPDDLSDVSFWDLYFVVFSDTVLQSLIEDCERGDWCLRDRFDYWEAMVMERVDMVMTSDVATDMCEPQVSACIETIPDQYGNCKSHKQLQFTSEVIRLVCELKQKTGLTPMCYRRTLEMLHVTLADIMRDTLEQDDDDVIEDVCNSPETRMTKGLICISNSCPGEGDTFKRFHRWDWFVSEESNLVSVCEIDRERCEVLLQKTKWMFNASDMEILIGISLVTMVTLSLIMFLGCFGWRRFRKNALLKDGYQQLLTEGDEA